MSLGEAPWKEESRLQCGCWNAGSGRRSAQSPGPGLLCSGLYFLRLLHLECELSRSLAEDGAGMGSSRAISDPLPHPLLPACDNNC